MHDRRRRWPRRLGLLGAGLFVGLLLAEIVLRIVGIGFPSLGQLDPVLGWSVRPGIDVVYETEGRGRIQTNDDGLRDRRTLRRKQPDVLRIAVLGDSFTFGANVDVAATFCAVAESELDACELSDGRRIEVVNFGVTGYGTAQQLLLLRERVWSYQPDMVLLAFLTSNDLDDNVQALAPHRLAPFYTLADGELVLDDSFNRTSAYRIRRLQYALVYRSRLAQLIKQLRNNMASGSLSQRTQRESLLAFTVPERYRPPEQPPWRQAWDVTEALIRQMHSEVVAGGSRFAVVTLTNPVQVHPDREMREALQAELGIDDLWYADDRIAALGQDAGIPVIALARRFQAEAEATGVYLHGFDNAVVGAGHWNAAGHALAGRILAEQLCPILRGPGGEAEEAHRAP